MSNYPLRLPDHVLSAAKALAAESGTSLNQFLSSLIAERVGEMRTLNALKARARSGDPERGLGFVDLVPDRQPVEGDELP